MSDAGMAGAFIVFLVWQHREQSKRLDAYVNKLLETLATVEQEREAGFDKVRDRYDEVIAKYDSERDRLLLEIGTKLDHILEKLNQ
jgi:vacuolar-type H+-ATPase subunit I/STV1